MSTVLDENSTTEEIHDRVDEIVAAEEAELKEGSDSERIAEENETPPGERPDEDIAVDDSGSDSPDEDDDTGDSEDQSWIDDDLKAEVAAYGLSDEELADFGSREELDRALRIFDRSALEAGRKAMADGDKSNERGADGRFQKKEESESKPDEGKFEITLDSDEWDTDMVDQLTKMRDHYDDRISVLENRLLQADANAEEQHFDGLVDGMGHADLFGKSGKENSKQLERRTDLLVAAKAHILGMEQLGRKAELDENLLTRVARMAFPEEISKKELKSRTKKIQDQSKKRLGGSPTKPQDMAETDEEWAKRYYKELESRGL